MDTSTVQNGCPKYLLRNKLQNEQRKYDKWKARSIIGEYIGQSRLNSSKVSLVLSIKIGHVSPQFH